MHALAGGELERARDDVLLGVEDDVVGAADGARGGGLGGGRGRADDGGGARALGELREEEAEAARDRVDEDGVAGAHAVGLFDEGERGEPLQGGGGGGAEGHAGGEDEGFGPGDGGVFGVHAEEVLEVGREGGWMG